ncbi:unnamed protein product [Amoebophrya sp. A120]|nr:unnamed protein product [Amoebophrya sp. A120]|eukprot:GSA120T00001450001.1
MTLPFIASHGAVAPEQNLACSGKHPSTRKGDGDPDAECVPPPAAGKNDTEADIAEREHPPIKRCTTTDHAPEEPFLKAVLRRYGCFVGRHPNVICYCTIVTYVIIICFGVGRGAGAGDYDNLERKIEQDNFMNHSPMELQWSSSGGKLEKGIRLYRQLIAKEKISERGRDKESERDVGRATNNDWQDAYHTTMFVPRDLEENVDSPPSSMDAATLPIFREMLELQKQIYKLEVTVDVSVPAAAQSTQSSVRHEQLKYSFYDLCKRGLFPDQPGGGVVMPCMLASPLTCFKETGDVNHESYRELDETIQDIMPLQVPYSTRPSLLDGVDIKTDADLKQVLSGWLNPADPGNANVKSGGKGSENASSKTGCVSDNALLTWSHDLVTSFAEFDITPAEEVDGGDASDSTPEQLMPDVRLSRALGFRFATYIDAPAKVQYRMSLNHPRTQDFASKSHLANIKTAIRKMDRAYHNLVSAFNENAQHTEVSNFPTFFLDDFEDELENVDTIYFNVGLGISAAFTYLILVSLRHPLACRSAVGLAGLHMIVLSELFGFVGLYFYVFGKQFNSTILLVLPVLALGVGLDDMFVIIRYFSGLGYAFFDSHRASPEEIIGETLARAGVGTTLSSLCNILAFGAGAFLPIPAMADFCLAATLLALSNYITTLNLLLPVLSYEVERIQNLEAESVNPLIKAQHQDAFRRALQILSTGGDEDEDAAVVTTATVPAAATRHADHQEASDIINRKLRRGLSMEQDSVFSEKATGGDETSVRTEQKNAADIGMKLRRGLSIDIATHIPATTERGRAGTVSEKQAHLLSGCDITATHSGEFMGSSDSFEKKLLHWLSNSYAPNVICHPVASVFLSLSGFALCAVSVWAIVNVDSGWAPKDLLPTDHYLYRAFELVFSMFSTFESTLIIHNPAKTPLDIAASQRSILTLVRDLYDTTFISLGYLNVLTLLPYTTFVTLQAGANVTAAVAVENRTTRSTTSNAVNNGTVDSALGPAAQYALDTMKAPPYCLDQSWTDPVFAPLGTLTNRSAEFYDIYNDWAKLPPAAEANKSIGYLYADIGWSNLFHWRTNGAGATSNSGAGGSRTTVRNLSPRSLAGGAMTSVSTTGTMPAEEIELMPIQLLNSWREVRGRFHGDDSGAEQNHKQVPSCRARLHLRTHHHLLGSFSGAKGRADQVGPDFRVADFRCNISHFQAELAGRQWWLCARSELDYCCELLDGCAAGFRDLFTVSLIQHLCSDLRPGCARNVGGIHVPLGSGLRYVTETGLQNTNRGC